MTRRPTRRRPASGARPSSIVWTDRAVSDLEAIGDHIARDDPSAAARWVAKLVDAAERVATAPLARGRVPELGRDDVREALLRSYRVVYRIDRGRVVVLTVFEGHRRLPADVMDQDAP
ncbi:MAG TPA: type II toxin-antitoxin system RelE/ParE family toxin [Kofleriaceae bacterium]|nr:type II toxin-antitoxin system RelE/ParE family toxin [Kofleriaceae bacterium]